MTFSRKILIGIICASCVFATDAFAPATDKVYTKRTINGKVVMQDQYCNTEGDLDRSACRRTDPADQPRGDDRLR